jgi:hypothetical protein
MTKYTYAQLEGLWIKAGGSKGLAPLMAAIAEAESGGDSTAENDKDNDGTQTSWGLWQISDGTHNQPVPNILSPSVNAQQAVAKYKTEGLGAWGTYTTGAYKAYMGSSTPDLNVPGAAGTIQAATDTAKIEPYSTDTCLFGFPGISMPLVGNVGQFCLLPKHTGRAFIGIMLMTAGAFIALPGVAMIMIDVGLRAAGPIGGAAQRTGRVVSWVAPEAGAAMSAAGSAASRGRRPQRNSAPAPEVREAQQASRTRVREQARTTPAQGQHATERERRGRGGRHAAPAAT